MRTRSIFPLLLLLALVSLVSSVAYKILTGLEIPPPSPIMHQGSLTIDPISATLKTGETLRIKAIFTPARPACLDNRIHPCRVPERAPYEVEASFTSSDPSVATVDAIIRQCASLSPGITSLCSPQYFVRGIAPGSATITASYANSEGTFTAKMAVAVSGSNANHARGSLSLVPPTATLAVGETVNVRAIFTPRRPACLDAVRPCEIAEPAPYEVDIALVSSDKSIAVSMCPPESGRLTCIGSNGVRGVSPGSALVTGMYVNTIDGTFVATMAVTVTATPTTR